MMEIYTGPCTAAELTSVSALFYKMLSTDAVFRAAFPDPSLGRVHCREFVAAYAADGEIHRVMNDGTLAAAALWSLPWQNVPSPTWDFKPEEPCCKLYLMASRLPGAGSALLDFAAARFAGQRLVTLCAQAKQAAYFRRRGFTDVGRTDHGTVLEWSCAPLTAEIG